MFQRIAIAAVLLALVPLGVVAWHQPLAGAAITALLLGTVAVATIVSIEREGPTS